MTDAGKAPRLFPSQVCFIVDDVPTAVESCTERFGWGPFQQFSAPVAQAHYRGWSGRKLTEVALGMAGQVQVELMHVHEGRDAVRAYQEEYGTGFQHLGIGCKSRDEAVRHLEAHGAVMHELTEYAGVRIAFVDVPTGQAMFELLQPTGQASGDDADVDVQPNDAAIPAFELDRATIATADLESALRFYAAAFRWEDARPETKTLRYGTRETRIERFIGRAGTLQLELLGPQRRSDDPYSRHLARSAHGLVHAGGVSPTDSDSDLAAESIGSTEYEWLEDGERFALHDWAGGAGALQVRQSTESSAPSRSD